MNTKTRNERGQVMVLLAIGAVVFLGFVALAIDGSMAYSDRRRAQNAADASSIAGGGAAALSLENSYVHYSEWDCEDSRIVAAQQAAATAAISRAAANLYVIDTNVSDYNGVTTTCGETDRGPFVDKYIDVTALISVTTKTSFAQLIFGGQLRSRVSAIVRVRPSSPLAYGHAIVALNPNGCNGNKNGALFGGSSTVNINGGGIWSNGCLSGDGNKYTADVNNGSISYRYWEGTHTGFSPAPEERPAALPTLPPSITTIPKPNCASPSAHHLSSIKMNNNKDSLTLAPGLYCIDGDVDVSGGTLSGTDVTIYVGGSVKITGGATISLDSPPSSPDPTPAIAGVLFYVPTGDIDLEGNGTSGYVGVVYAPKGTIKVHGTAGVTPTFNTQLVGYNVDVRGNANIDINFNAPENYSKPAAIELYK